MITTEYCLVFSISRSSIFFVLQELKSIASFNFYEENMKIQKRNMNNKKNKSQFEFNPKNENDVVNFNLSNNSNHCYKHRKIKYMEAEHGDSLELMRQIKRAFDPDNLMNPGKMIPT